MPRTERPAMSAYGVPDDLDGALPWEWASERLERSWNYWVCTVDPDGRPHSMPVWGIWLPDDERFWFSCSPESLKARNMAANPQVVVATDDTVEVVSLEGTAEAVEAREDIAMIYGQKYEPGPAKRPDLIEFVLANAMYVVRPVKAFGIIERSDRFQSSATRWVW